VLGSSGASKKAITVVTTHTVIQMIGKTVFKRKVALEEMVFIVAGSDLDPRLVSRTRRRDAPSKRSEGRL